MTLKFIIAAALALSIQSPAFSQTNTWTVDPAQSSLGFEVQQGGNALTGTFKTWTASIDFDPDAPETANISAKIQPASVSTGNPQFDGTLPNADWFDAAAFPEAEFTATNVLLIEGNSYRATGTLKIKGISHPVDLDFTLKVDGDIAKAEGQAILKRLDYNLGSGIGAETVGDAVTVTLDLTASR